MTARSTTPSLLRKSTTRVTLIGTAIFMAISTPIIITNRVSADRYDDQIASLQAQANQFQSQANQYKAQAATLQQALDQITAQKNAIIAQIDLSQQQYDQLQLKITDTNTKITANKNALGDTLASLYVDGKISSIEMLASSQSVTDFIDKQAYQSSVRDALTKTIDEIQTLKKQLEDSKAKLAVVMQQQQSQKASLAASEAEQARLVDETKGQEAAYQQLANSAQSQMESAAAQQRAYYASLAAQNGGSFNSGVVGSFVFANFSGNMPCGAGGYPYCGAQDSYADPWNLYNRECVSYAAWRIEQLGHKVQPFQGDGMAYQWGQGAARGAWRVSEPQRGDAVVLPAMGGFAPVGHLMVVESVNGDWVHVSQYNFGGTGQYSTMDIKRSGVIFLRFP